MGQSGVLDKIYTYCTAKAGVTEGFPFGEETLVLKVGGKIFALMGVDAQPLRINLKSDPLEAIQLRERYEGVAPGYHMNKTHWNTVTVGLDVPPDVLFGMIDRSWELVYESLPRKARQPDVLFEDNHLLVVNKAPGVLSQADSTGDMDVLTLAKMYVARTRGKKGAVYMGLVHRLDRPAGGVMVLACTSKAAARLSKQFRERSATKEYEALVEGRLAGEGVWEDRLEKRDGHVHVVKTGGKEARLTWRAVETFEVGHGGGGAGSGGAGSGAQVLTRVRITLDTGRAHQIRVQCAERGHPILGDFRYGSRNELDGKNLALHARRLTLEHPVKREEMTFEAAPPRSWPG